MSFLKELQVKRFLSLAVALLVALLVFSGCDNPFADDDSGSDSIAVKGEWVLVDSWGTERWTITNNSIHYEFSSDGVTFTTNYRADIVKYRNGRLNAGDSALTAGREETNRPGFAVIRYTEAANAGWGEVGKYNVFRWARNNADDSLRDFTQGDVFTHDVFATAAAAEAGATNATGYFGFASMGASKAE